MTVTQYQDSLKPEDINKIKELVEAIETGHETIDFRLNRLLQDLSDKHHIVRTLELPENFQQPALSLLGFFGRVAAHLHPDIDVKVTVTQHRNTIKLIVGTAREHRQMVEATLEQYGRVLRHKAPMNTLFENETHIMELKQKLDISALELSITTGLLLDEDVNLPTDFASVEELVEQLHITVGMGLSAVAHLHKVINELLEQERTLVSNALLTLKEKLEAPTLAATDKNEVKAALAEVQEQEPDTFEEIKEAINKTSESGKAGDYLYGWISAIANALPK